MNPIFALRAETLLGVLILGQGRVGLSAFSASYHCKQITKIHTRTHHERQQTYIWKRRELVLLFGALNADGYWLKV